jgi:hypothetical protein
VVGLSWGPTGRSERKMESECIPYMESSECTVELYVGCEKNDSWLPCGLSSGCNSGSTCHIHSHEICKAQ